MWKLHTFFHTSKSSKYSYPSFEDEGFQGGDNVTPYIFGIEFEQLFLRV